MLINLTPHTLNIHLADGSVREVPPSGAVARVATLDEILDPIDGIPVARTSFGEVVGLPDPAPGVAYVVSLLVAQAVGRPDVLSPGDLVRDEGGRPIGCRGLRSSV